MTDPTTTPAPERGRLAHRDVQTAGTPQIASAVPVSVPSPDAGSGRSGDPGGRNEPSGDIVETAALDAAARAWGYRDFADVAPECPGEREGLRVAVRAVLDAVTPLIAARERAKVAAAHCPVCLHPWDTYHSWDGCRYVINRTADPSSPGVVCYCAEPRAARAVQLARRAARPVTGEGDRG